MQQTNIFSVPYWQEMQRSICKVQKYVVNNVTIVTICTCNFSNCSSNALRRTGESYITGRSVFIGKCTFKPWRCMHRALNWLIATSLMSQRYTFYNKIKCCHCRIGSLQPKLEEGSKCNTCD